MYCENLRGSLRQWNLLDAYKRFDSPNAYVKSIIRLMLSRWVQHAEFGRRQPYLDLECLIRTMSLLLFCGDSSQSIYLVHVHDLVGLLWSHLFQ
jgi:hypothetical protein